MSLGRLSYLCVHELVNRLVVVNLPIIPSKLKGCVLVSTTDLLGGVLVLFTNLVEILKKMNYNQICMSYVLLRGGIIHSQVLKCLAIYSLPQEKQQSAHIHRDTTICHSRKCPPPLACRTNTVV